jgi:hypothetical protein
VPKAAEKPAPGSKEYKAEKQREYRKRDHDAAKGVETLLLQAATECTNLPRSDRRNKLHRAILKALEACANV